MVLYNPQCVMPHLEWCCGCYHALLLFKEMQCTSWSPYHPAHVSALLGPSLRKLKEGFLQQSILLDNLQCPPKIKLQSRASVDPACLTSSSFFLIPTPEKTFFSSLALGSTECLVENLVLTSLTPTFLKRLCTEIVHNFLCMLIQTLKAFGCCCRLCLYRSLPHFVLGTSEVITGAGGFSPWLGRTFVH